MAALQAAKVVLKALDPATAPAHSSSGTPSAIKATRSCPS